jgi:solute:Na+ symporter, SSS family
VNLGVLDWSIVAGTFLLVLAVAIYAQRLNRSVADFLSANRCAGRYLLTLAMGTSSFGAITIIANFEKFYQAGFGALWWAQMMGPIALVIALSGYVIYRYRATKAMTIAQFYEMRYSHRFRIFAGILAFLSGILNYGIFPLVTARFIVYFFGFPAELTLWGWAIPTTAPVMAVMLTTAVVITLLGGQITVMIADFLQSQIMLLAFLLATLLLLFTFGWGNIMETLVAKAPAGKSMVNPFDQSEIPDFNVFFFLILAFNAIYNYMAWQGSQAYNSSASSPHEAKMARVLGEWRNMVNLLAMVSIPVCVFVFMHGMGDAEAVGAVKETLGGMGDPQLVKQMQVPVALNQLLPAGLLGLFCAALIAAAISTDDTYLHSWGSIFVQDVVMPIRNKHLSAAAHMLLLRFAVVGVAVFVFVFGLIFPLKEYIYMYWALTGSIYLGGAGSVIIGGLYTRWGTTAGAWAAMATGSTIGFTGLILRQGWHVIPGLTGIAPDFPFNGVQVSFFGALCSITAYVILSVLTRHEPFDLDAMLHRATGQRQRMREEAVAAGLNRFQRMIGIGVEFTRGDRIIYYLKIGWLGFFFSVFVVVTVFNTMFPGVMTDSGWVLWWTIQISIIGVAAVITLFWFGIGGILDMIKLFKHLHSLNRNEFDDGTVSRDSPTTVPVKDDPR